MNFEFPEIGVSFYTAAMPVFILGIGSLIALMQSVFKPIGSKLHTSAVLFVALATAFASLFAHPEAVRFLGGSYVLGHLALFGQGLILALAMLWCGLKYKTHIGDHFFRGEMTSLFLLVVTGMLVMVSADEVISLFIGLELASIGIYTLVGYINPNRKSQEGAVKYLVLGSFASGFLLFGFALLYATSGTLVISEMLPELGRHAAHPWTRVGGIFVMLGLGFKFALAPFHMWAPDVYESAPTGITGFMATTVKVMVIVAMLRFLAPSMSDLGATWGPFLMVSAVLSAIIGNIMALVQSSLKRMLAYSSIAHAGYIAIGLCALGGNDGALSIAAVLFYVATYCVISLGAFAVIMWLESDQHDNLQLDDIAGLSKKHPWAAFALASFMFSFAGIPPSAGFMGKFFVFSVALNAKLYVLVVIGLIGAVISLYYYLRVIVRMYMNEPIAATAQLAPIRSNFITGVTAATLAIILLVGTLLPGHAMNLVKTASQSFMAH